MVKDVASTSGEGKKTLSKVHLAKLQKGRKDAVPMAKKTGLILPPMKFMKAFKKGRYAQRVSPACGVYAAGAVEWLMLEILEAMIDSAKRTNSRMLHPRHITNAIANDEELTQLFSNVIIARGGVGQVYSTRAEALGKKIQKKGGLSKKKDMTDEPTRPNSEDEGSASEEANESGDEEEEEEEDEEDDEDAEVAHGDSQQY